MILQGGTGHERYQIEPEAKSQLSLVGPRVPESWDGGHGGQGSPAVLYSVLPVDTSVPLMYHNFCLRIDEADVPWARRRYMTYHKRQSSDEKMLRKTPEASSCTYQPRTHRRRTHAEGFNGWQPLKTNKIEHLYRPSKEKSSAIPCSLPGTSLVHLAKWHEDPWNPPTHDVSVLHFINRNRH